MSEICPNCGAGMWRDTDYLPEEDESEDAECWCCPNCEWCGYQGKVSETPHDWEASYWDRRKLYDSDITETIIELMPALFLIGFFLEALRIRRSNYERAR